MDRRTFLLLDATSTEELRRDAAEKLPLRNQPFLVYSRFKFGTAVPFFRLDYSFVFTCFSPGGMWSIRRSRETPMGLGARQFWTYGKLGRVDFTTVARTLRLDSTVGIVPYNYTAKIIVLRFHDIKYEFIKNIYNLTQYFEKTFN